MKALLQILFLLTLATLPNFLLAEAKLKSIDFKQEGEESLLELTFDNDTAQGKRIHIADDKQIILDIKNVDATDKVLRDFDTSEFLGSIVYVSSYRNPSNQNDLRVALQLRENVRSSLVREKNKLILKVENRFGVFSQDGTKLSRSYSPKQFKSRDKKTYHAPKSDSLKDILHNLTLSGKKKYIGKKISLNVKNMAVEDILRIIAEASGFNIIMSKHVSTLPPLSLNLANTPWDQILDIILSLHKLVAKRNGVILMIESLDSAVADAKKAAEAKKSAAVEKPLITKIFPISYAKLESLQKILADYTTSRGKISPDQRTNSLIIIDTSEALDRIKKIVETLDTQTPQVLIESKIVEIVESYSKELGLRDGISFGYDPIGEIGGKEAGIIGAEGSTGQRRKPMRARLFF